MRRSGSTDRLRDATLAAALLAFQTLLVAPLFAGPLTRWRQSIEAAFIADARFIAERFPALSWNPLWYLGFPFELFYTPLLPALVALVSPVLGGAAPAYRALAATGYVLGVAGLYVLARTLGTSRATAVLAAALFACTPGLSALVLPGLGADAGAFTGSALPLPWRLAVLVEYGEGPHVFGLTLLLFATAAFFRHLERGGARSFWLAALLLVAVALTNLIALLGAAIFVAGCAFAVPAPRQWLERAVRVAATAGLLSLAWYSPGFIRAVGGFSTPGGEGGAGGYLAFPLVAAAIALVARRLPRQPAAIPVLGFAAATSAAILAAWYLGRVTLAPQPIRYALELDAAVAVLLAIGVGALLRRVVPAARFAAAPLVAIAVLVLLASLPGWLAVQRNISPDPDWMGWSEREVALWLDDHLEAGERAYLSGSHAFWVDVFADVPQIRGGVDFAATDPWWAHAVFQINNGSDADVSVLWLRAFGVRYVVVTGPESRDAYRDFAKPDMFEGRLELAATIQGARIYRVDRTRSAAGVVAGDAVLPAPRDALDGAALRAYLDAIEQGLDGGVARLEERAPGEWRGTVESTARPARLLVPVAYDEGWRAYLDDLDNPHYNDRPAHATPDPVGLLSLDVPAGRYAIRVEHRLHRDHLLSLAVTLAALGLFGLARVARRGAMLERAAPLAIAAAVAAYSVALGVVVGFPKGTDALMHLTRLRFVADWFPNHNWLYAWSAGMPTFTSYPALPYLLALPAVRAFGAEPTLQCLAALGQLALGLGIFGHFRERGRSTSVALIASLMAVTSLATWEWIVQAGVYARIVSLGLAALAWWAHARALRTDRAVWWVAATVLIAASVASHPVMGALSAVYLAGVQLGARGVAGLRRLATIAGVAMLLAAPALIPTIVDGMSRSFLGFERQGLSALDPTTLVRPDWIGLAAFVVPLSLVLLELPRRAGAAVVGGVFLSWPILYGFAPALGIPSSWYYFRGIDPSSITFVIALVGALVFGGLATDAASRGRRLLVPIAALLVAGNVVAGVPLYLAMPDYPSVIDTSGPYTPEELARTSLSVESGDLSHRLLPFTATESVGFTYWHRKPMLRDYYDQGQIHPDWIAWAFNAVYTPPLDPTEVRSVIDWFGLDTITVPAGDQERALAAMPWLRPVVLLERSPYRQFAIEGPSTIVAASSAPLVVVVADAGGYDRATRVLLADGTTPRTRLSIWWDGTLADLPADLAGAAAAVLVVGDRLGERSGAETLLRSLATREVSVVWDLGDVPAGEVGEPWPAATLAVQDIASWDVQDRAARIAGADFSPARFGDGPWRATVPAQQRSDAYAELTLAGAPLVSSRRFERATLTVVGGNLFYHALSNANAREIAYVAGFLGPKAGGAEREPDWTFVNPDVREVRTDGTPLVVKESFHPGWRATFVDPAGASRSLPIRLAGPGLMAVVPPGPGLVRLEFGPSLGQILSWVLFVLGLAAAAALIVRERRRRPA